MDYWRLSDRVDFLIQVGEGGFKGFAVLRVGGGFEVVDDAYSGELEVLTLLVASQLLGGLGRGMRLLLLLFE